MKITTQRSLLWLGNVVFALALVGLVLVFQKTVSKDARKKVNKETRAANKLALAEVKLDKKDSGSDDDVGAQIKRIKDKNFFYMGYVAPLPPPESEPEGVVGPPVPPAVSDLVEVHFLIAPRREGMAKPDFLDDAGRVVLKIKELSGENIFTYSEGSIIGAGAQDEPDAAKSFEKWGGARIIRIETDRIVCRWVNYDKAEDEDVTMTGHVSKAQRDGKQINFGAGGATKGGSKKSSSSDDKLFVTNTRGNRVTTTITKAGWKAFSENGSALVDSISFERAKNLQGKDALKVAKIPGPLREYGLQDGDIIVRIDSQFVTSKESISRYVQRTYRNKSSYRVNILRNGQSRMLQVGVPRDVRKLSGSLNGTRVRGGGRGR